MKKTKIIIYNIFFFFLFFIIFDLIASNLILKIDNFTCYKIEREFYELKKSCTGRHQFKPSFPVVKIITNNIGLRSNKLEIDINKKPKIFFFGDSFTFGVGIDYEKTFVGLLEKRFNNYNFYNFAVGSYSPSMHLYRLEQAIKNKMIPEKAILLLDLTDIYDEGARWYTLNSKPQLVSDHIFKKYTEKKKFTHKNFQITRLLASKLNYNIRILKNKFKKNFLTKNKEEVKTSFQGNFTYTEKKNLNKNYWSEKIFATGVQNIKNKVDKMSNILKKNGSEFYLVIYPWAETLVYGQKTFDWEKFGQELCIQEKCILVNSFDKFKERKNRNKNWYSNLYFVGDEHFNNGGNLIIANILEDKIFKKNY